MMFIRLTKMQQAQEVGYFFSSQKSPFLFHEIKNQT